MNKCLMLVLAACLVASGLASDAAAQSPGREKTAAKPRQGSSAIRPSTAPRDDIGYAVKPSPSWVVPAAESTDTPPQMLTAAQMHYRLIDDQVLLDEKSAWHHVRVVRVVNSGAALAAAGQIELAFDPSYQKLELHKVSIFREGKSLDRLDTRGIKVLQREKNLERQIYDGRKTLSIVLSDLRVGDQVEYAYSIQGANPVFGGKHAAIHFLGTDGGPVALRQIRLLTPEGRQIRAGGVPADMAVSTRAFGKTQETIYRLENLPQLQLDTQAHPVSLLKHAIYLTEFAGWAEVVRWGMALYQHATAGVELDRLASELSTTGVGKEELALAALKFVQTQIRYFGTEIGASSHRPTDPEIVLTRRFGDCKDKVGVLVALLKRLGIDAEPVFVSNLFGPEVASLPPSPLNFDHVIARVRLDGQTYWLDPTRALQTGPLSSRQALYYGQGLVLAPGEAQLTALPEFADLNQLAVEDHFTIANFTEPPILKARITYFGSLAEDFREALEQGGSKPIIDQVTGRYLRIYPGLMLLSSRTENSASENTASVLLEFKVPKFWKYQEQKYLTTDLIYWATIDSLRFPNADSRRDPYAPAAPGVYRHMVRVEFPESVLGGSSPSSSEDGDKHFRLRLSREETKTSFTGEARLQARGRYVNPDAWKVYTAAVAKQMPRLGITLRIPAIPAPRLDALRETLQQLEADIRADRVAAKTSIQVAALFKITAFGEQLKGGRLSPEIRAEALIERGKQLDNLGRFAEAEKDFAEALALAPDSVDALNAAAINAFQQRKFKPSLDFVDAALQREPGNSEAIRAKGLTSYFSGDLVAARAAFEQMLRDSDQVRRGYPLILLALAMQRSGSDPGALKATFETGQLPRDWPRPVLDLYFGSTTPDAVIASAKKTANAAGALCEAHFYLGEKYHAEGDQERAKEHWEQSMKQNVIEYIEHWGAKQRLGALDAK